MCSFWSSSGIRLCKRKDEIDELLKILNVRGCQTSVPRSSFLTVQSLSKSVRSWLAALCRALRTLLRRPVVFGAVASGRISRRLAASVPESLTPYPRLPPECWLDSVFVECVCAESVEMPESWRWKVFWLRVLESRIPEEDASDEGVPGVPRSMLVCVEWRLSVEGGRRFFVPGVIDPTCISLWLCSVKAASWFELEWLFEGRWFLELPVRW